MPIQKKILETYFETTNKLYVKKIQINRSQGTFHSYYIKNTEQFPLLSLKKLWVKHGYHTSTDYLYFKLHKCLILPLTLRKEVLDLGK